VITAILVAALQCPIQPNVPVLDLSKELVIGSVDGLDDAFGRVSSIALDAAGNIYVLDPSASVVRVFTEDGTPRGTFGGRGAGPGEFLRPFGISVDGQKITVFDLGQNRSSSFSLAGDLLADSSLPHLEGHVLGTVQPLRSGVWLGLTMAVMRSGQISHVPRMAILAVRGANVDTLATYGTGFVYWYNTGSNVGFGHQNNVTTGIGGGVVAIGDSVVVVGDGNSGTLTRYSVQDGRVVAEWRRAIGEPDPVTSSDLRTLRSEVAQSLRDAGDRVARRNFRILASDVWSSITALIADGGDGVWVRKGGRDLVDARQCWTRYDAEGVVRAALHLPAGLALGAAAGNKAYASGFGPSGEPIVVVFRLGADD